MVVLDLFQPDRETAAGRHVEVEGFGTAEVLFLLDYTELVVAEMSIVGIGEDFGFVGTGT